MYDYSILFKSHVNNIMQFLLLLKRSDTTFIHPIPVTTCLSNHILLFKIIILIDEKNDISIVLVL